MEQLEQKTITSVEVAEMVGKAHNELLKDIRRYVSQLNEGNLPHVEFFNESTYQDSKNELRPCYNITLKGCEFIGNKLTGVKGSLFTAKYINRFHEMKDELQQPKKLTALEQLHLQNQALLEVNDKVEEVKNDLEEFKQELPLLGCDMDRITTAVRTMGVQCLGGKKSNAYADKSLRSKVYSDIYDQLKRQFGVTTYKSIRRNQCDTAVEVVRYYKLPMVLEQEIEGCNAQESLFQ